MKDIKTQQRFVMLRSQGWSFARIAQELNVSGGMPRSDAMKNGSKTVQKQSTFPEWSLVPRIKRGMPGSLCLCRAHAILRNLSGVFLL